MYEPNEFDNINEEAAAENVTESAPAEEPQPEMSAAPQVEEEPLPREAYSDAGYVSSDAASVVPPVYHCRTPEPPKEKKPRRGINAGGLIAACLVCAIVGGIAGGAIGGRVSGGNAAAPADGGGSSTGTVITQVKATPTPVSTSVVDPGEEMSAGDIYNMACRQAVAITTEITTTNLFGYTSSAAVSGSGFIISQDGYILTNYHVIEDANEGGYDITVLTYDGTKYTASIVGYEQDNDIAVLKIEASGLDAVTIGDSDAMSVGDTVYAVGNPLGELQYTMTSGMVSALDRDISSTDQTTGVVTTISMFQIDAAVNSGNSGGPVYNSRGEVIGVVTAKYSSTGVEGLGFAIPINDAVSIATELISNGYVTGKAYMGVYAQTVTSAAAQYYNMVEGAYVYQVAQGSCAEKCGLKTGDIIVAIDDHEIASRSDLVSAKKDYKAGDSAVLKVYRSGEYIELTIVFDEETPEEESADNTQGQTGGVQNGSYYYYNNPSGNGGWVQQRP